MDQSSLQLIHDVGTKLSKQSRPTKDFIVKSLRQVVDAFACLEQSYVPDASGKSEAPKKMESSINPLMKSIINGLLRNRDKDVRLLLAICVSEIFRVLAPEPPFEDKYLRDVFILLLSSFSELADTTSPLFSWRVKILETVARCKCCVIMLDIGCNDLVLEMFNTFFSVLRDYHEPSLVNNILSIMTHILSEDASLPLVDVVLHNLVKEEKGEPTAASRLAVSIIETCAETLEPFICGFLTSCISERDVVGSELKEFYHEIVFRIFQCVPQMLLPVIPNLALELVTDQVDVRIKAVKIIGRLLALPGHCVAQKYRGLFMEFLKRFCDKSAEVRIHAIQCAKDCYTANPASSESLEVLAAVEERLLDLDDRVRTQAIIVVCDIARSTSKFVPVTLISQVAERLRDKRISVRKKALQKLLEVYRDYCDKCSKDQLTMKNDFEQIPCKVLMLCYDKDCKEFRSQCMELVLVEDLFPADLSVEERTRHWIHLFSLFNIHHEKALGYILLQKQRLQNELRTYLGLRKKDKENRSEETEKQIETAFVKMAACFPDATKAKESFHKLNQIKDNNIFNYLELLLDQSTIVEAEATREKLLRMIGSKQPHFEFLKSLSLKCSYNLFSTEHVHFALGCILSNRVGNKHLESPTGKLLLAIISIFPSLLRGLEGQLLRLLEESNPIDCKLIEILSKAGPHLSIELRDVYPFLERLCLEGTCAESKRAVSAIAALASTSGHFWFSKLCKELVDSLHRGLNLPTVLQSLGCIAKYSVSTFDDQDVGIIPYIYENIFHVDLSDNLNKLHDDAAGSNSSDLKIYGLKTLVKSFLPHQGTPKRNLGEFLNILSRMLNKCEASVEIIPIEDNQARIRLAAAKSVLRLAKRWDSQITPEIFHLTILMAKDPSSFVRRLFIDKAHKLLKEQAIPTRYACAFAFCISDSMKDLQDDSLKYMAEFIEQYNKIARMHQTSVVQEESMTFVPAYIVVFLIYILAHDSDFPHVDCQDENVYAQFCSPLLFVLQMLVNADVNGSKETVLYLHSIFRAIKRVEDAVDMDSSHKLHILADIGLSFVTALNSSGVSLSCAPKQILLPLSLYRVNSRKLSRHAYDECFVGRVIKAFQSQIILPVNTSIRGDQKFLEEDIMQTNINPCSSMSMRACKQVETISSRATKINKTVNQEIIVGRRRKRAASPTMSAPIELRECSQAQQNFPANREKGKFSSQCGTTEASLVEGDASIQNVDVNVTSQDDVLAKRSLDDASPMYVNDQLTDPYSMKISVGMLNF
ncbi:sister chromatid cohesion protein PDS5 homolog A-like isoform X2 [Cucurbita maxima]|uniref:Sister chromatid cohesion protein PDS5 homolog A-like isoform X2 n=1 Tax=Cucurbita maxima TaxID=3661 RepID=A0A6J1IHJ2_CUCMA|nr:sister chromatid cohesion protein PDS5 homolog A-like isoform X2 [Cucurbita maxima]XP_022976676.1 sister chromatid cohesion protein PDS5 homolog A-like isoform X2 [Cucurbita maxima]